MEKIATITKKRQITIPSDIFKKTGLSEGQKVVFSEKDGQLLLRPAVALVERLAGSLKVPSRWKKKTTEEIVEQSKRQYFAKGVKR